MKQNAKYLIDALYFTFTMPKEICYKRFSYSFQLLFLLFASEILTCLEPTRKPKSYSPHNQTATPKTRAILYCTGLSFHSGPKY